MRIRRAVPEDAAQIADILRQSFLEFKPLYTTEGFTATTPDQYQVARRLDEGPAWVALCGERMAGTASGVLRAERGLYIRGVAVVPPARGLGIAQALMSHVEAFARHNRCVHMFLTTTPFLTSAIRLYEGLGFRHTGTADLFGTPLLKMSKDLCG